MDLELLKRVQAAHEKAVKQAEKHCHHISKDSPSYQVIFDRIYEDILRQQFTNIDQVFEIIDQIERLPEI